MGAMQFSASNYHAAAAMLRKATDRNPNLPLGRSLYCRALLEDEQYDAVKAAFHRAIEADPKDFDANLNLGGTLRHDGELQAAAPYLEKVLSLRPDPVKALYQLDALKAATGALEDALKYLEPVAEKWPDFQQLHVQLASIYQKQHRIEDSRRERQIVLDLDKKDRKHGLPSQE